MHSKYKVLKFSSNKFDDIEDLVSIEEPLEISLKFQRSRSMDYSKSIYYNENSRSR